MTWIYTGSIALLLAAGCGAPDNTAPHADDTEGTHADFDEAGGILSYDGGAAMLLIPEGALVEVVTVSITSEGDTGPAGALSDVFNFGPDGQQFLRPIEVALRADDLPGNPTIATFDTAISEWVELPSIAGSDGVITAQIEHFSRYVVVNGESVPLVPIANVSVVPGTRVRQVTNTWDQWERLQSGVVVSGTASPDGQGSWTGHLDGVNTVGSFQISGGQFSFPYDILTSGANLSLVGTGSWYTVDVSCPGGCPDGTGTGTGTGGGPPLETFGCAMSMEEEVAPVPTAMDVAGFSLLTGHGAEDSRLYNQLPNGTLSLSDTFARETSVHGDGPYIYTVGFNRLKVFDIDGYGQISERGNYGISADLGLEIALGVDPYDQVTHNDRQSLAILGNMLYLPVAAWVNGNAYRGGLVAIDVANRAAPNRVGVLDLGGAYPSEIATDGTYLYLLTWEGSDKRLIVVDVFDPMNPTVIASVPLPELALGDMAISGSTLAFPEDLISTNTGRLRLVDISSPANPVLGAAVETSGRTLENLTALGPWIFGTTHDATWIGVVDITSPALPALTGGKITDINGFVFEAPIQLLGVNLYVAGPNGTQRVDISDCLQ